MLFRSGLGLGSKLPQGKDQAAVAALVLLALGATLGWWVRQGGLQGRLLEVERAPALQASFLVDVNAADWPELAQLPGIGEVLARRIVEYRLAHGPYVELRQLLEVRGIGPRMFERMEPHLLPVGPPEAVARR
mgnify:FL=1